MKTHLSGAFSGLNSSFLMLDGYFKTIASSEKMQNTLFFNQNQSLGFYNIEKE